MANERQRRRRSEKKVVPRSRSRRQKQSRTFSDRIINLFRFSKGKRAKKKDLSWTLKSVVLAVGIVFVLALITYTTILYGGRLIADPEKLHITPPTTIETEDGEIIWYVYDEYRLPISLDEIPD